MYEHLKDFAGPLATVIAAGAAAYVAFRIGRAQADTSAGMLRATRERLALDLFDRRWQIIEELRKAVARVLREGASDTDVFMDFARASARAEFLFGSEVIEFLKKTQKTLASLPATAMRARTENPDRERYIDREAELITELSAFFEILDQLIRPYMAMTQRLPD